MNRYRKITEVTFLFQQAANQATDVLSNSCSVGLNPMEKPWRQRKNELVDTLRNLVDKLEQDQDELFNEVDERQREIIYNPGPSMEQLKRAYGLQDK